MSVSVALQEFRLRWLPHATGAGLSRLAELLQAGSPLLIHGAFSRCAAQGCLATHLGWRHPLTANLQHDAGIVWLTKVARMNPATSALLLEWDRLGIHDWELRDSLLQACDEELSRRSEGETEDEDSLELCGVGAN